MAELAWRTVQDGVPWDQRLGYMRMLRGTLWGQRLALGFQMQEVFYQLGLTRRGRLVLWLSDRLARRGQ